MYRIELEKGVYGAPWNGDPGRTLKIENAKIFSKKKDAKNELKKMIEKVNFFIKFPNAKVIWVDEITGRIKS